MTTLINHTNAKLNNWYSNAKLDYNVIGNDYIFNVWSEENN